MASMAKGLKKFRLWLEAMVLKAEIEGLRWWNRKKRAIRIPWKIGGQKYSKPDDGRIFMEWARYTGIYRKGREQLDYPEWRRIFSTKLHKSHYIKEVKSQSQRFCRQDPFRVYVLKKPKQHVGEAHRRQRCSTTKYELNPQGPWALEAQRLQPAAAGGTCQKQPQKVEALMDTPTVRAIFEMGFSKYLIKTVLEIQLATTGCGFPNAESLLDAIFELEASSNGFAPVVLSAAPSLPDTKNENSNMAENKNDVDMRAELCGENAEASAFTEENQMLHENLDDDRDFPNVESLQNALFELEASGSGLAPVVLSAAPDTKNENSNITENISGDGEVRAELCGGENAEASAVAKENQMRHKNLDDHRDFPNVESLQHAIFELEASGSGLAPVVLSAATSLPDTKNDNSNIGNWIYLEENRQLREVRLCKVCMDTDLDTAFVPCGHAVCCHRCSAELKSCPICQSVIRETMKIFLS